jgi:hypothetical protein
MIMLFNQLLDMPHLSGGWIILAKEKCSLTGCKKIGSKNLERNKLFVRMEKFGGSFMSDHKTWDQHFSCCVYSFVHCS